ncbi:MAG: Calcineurin-like phosphoesterase superfamily domain protein, partial [Armatimonadetes bacterium]|nr:Calcineurin-like phosphoesterase superfamily domain protein [Armatimonadota bacterium]
MYRTGLWMLLCLLATVLAGSGLDASGAEAPPRKAQNGRFPGLGDGPEKAWKGPFFFAQLADTQFGMFQNDERWEQESELFTRAVEQINRLKPRFVIICGDLVNQVSGEKHAPQVREFQRIARQIDPSIPLVCVCGNHDVGNRPTSATLAAYRNDFGDDWFSFEVAGLYGIVLNSSLYSDPTGAPAEQARQEAW